jgi:hypothetical protein
MATSSAVSAFSPRGYYAVDLLPFCSPVSAAREEAALLLILDAFLLTVAIYLKAAPGARNRHEVAGAAKRLHAVSTVSTTAPAVHRYVACREAPRGFLVPTHCDRVAALFSAMPTLQLTTISPATSEPAYNSSGAILRLTGDHAISSVEASNVCPCDSVTTRFRPARFAA